MKIYKRVIGIDVSKQRLDVADSDGKISLEVDNLLTSIQAKIIKLIGPKTDTLVVCEATGGLEHTLVDALHDAGIDVSIANPQRVRCFATAHGRLEKSDKIDAQMIMLFGKQVEVSLAKPRSEKDRHFTALMRRREQLVRNRVQEHNRLKQCNDPAIAEIIKETIKFLKTQEKTVNSEIKAYLQESAKTDDRIEVIMSHPGVAQTTTATLISDLPEIGTLNRGQIAKLVGTAPIIKQSGKTEKKRHARGGRSSVRSILFMATLSAIQRSPFYKAYYVRLQKKGKAKMVAIVACMRKIITTLNDMVRHKRKWEEPKGALQAQS
jgi:transposase